MFMASKKHVVEIIRSLSNYNSDGNKNVTKQSLDNRF